jgi:signal-transduction protein with cAMP-binding, CBS, and nucleotidyltransferase domain
MAEGGQARPGTERSATDRPQRSIICRFCGFENPVGGDACENCAAEFSEGMPESPLTFEGRLLGTSLGGLATGGALWLDADTDALDAVARMKADGTDCVLVGDGGRLVGIFTDRDAMVKLASRPHPVPSLREVMTAEPDVLRPGDTVAIAIHKMAVGRIRHLPLVDDDGSVTVVGARDLFRHLAARRD